MSNLNSSIDQIITKILTEEIEKKSEEMSEKLHGGQHKLDVAEPKGVLNKKDFEKLRQAKSDKQEVEEFFYNDNESTPGDYEGDEEAEEGAEELSAQEPTYVGRGLEDNKPTKMFGSFSDEHGWFGDDDREYSGEFDFDFDEEEFDEFEPFYEKHGKGQRWFAPGGEGKKWFDLYKEKTGNPFKVRLRKDMEEAETEEGNAFTGALENAREEGKKTFEVGGKEYRVSENKSLRLTEKELIDLIESIIIEEQKEVKDNIKGKAPVGLAVTEKSLKGSKKVNDQSTKETFKKMKEYSKTGSKEEFTEEPKHFPKNNGQLAKMKKKAYTPSKAVEEYIENLAYPGLQNLDYDEIKPNEDWLEKNIVGSSETGNNNEWANAEDTGNNKKMNDIRKANLYSKEKKRSYKRVAQPVDEAGEHEGDGTLDTIFTKLESVEEKKSKLVKEEMERMKNMIQYSRKTQ